MSDADQKKRPNRLVRPSWGEARFFLIAASIALILVAYVPFMAGYLPPNSTSTGAPFPLW